MNTLLLTVDIQNPNNNINKLQEASSILHKGGLVACPTETVYGLCANALDGDAVKSTYVAKGRPSDNPLIIHISDIDMLNKLVTKIPNKAKKLMDRFWPGALTIIFNKSDIVPYQTTGGLETVAIRMPSNKIMRELIKISELPLSAPSANLSGKPSPTTAKYVIEDMNGVIDCIIDGGKCQYGVESTIIDCTRETPVLLRPGSITVDMITEVIGAIEVDKTIIGKVTEQNKPKAPGMKYRHYAPKGEVVLVQGNIKNMPQKINELAESFYNLGSTVGVICTEETKSCYDYNKYKVVCIGTRTNLSSITPNLFQSLREMDENNIEHILCEGFSTDGEGLAIMNRLVKASSYNIINV